MNIFSEILFWNFYMLCKRNCHKIFNWAFTTNQSNRVKQHINKRHTIFDKKCLSQYFWGRQPLFRFFSNNISNKTGRYFWYSQSVFPRKPSWLKRVKRSWSLSRRRPSSASLEENIFIFFSIQTPKVTFDLIRLAFLSASSWTAALLWLVPTINCNSWT